MHMNHMAAACASLTHSNSVCFGVLLQMAHEMALSVPQNVTAWGWKHPYALYTLSFLYQVSRLWEH
jgi:hypothetical protein